MRWALEFFLASAAGLLRFGFVPMARAVLVIALLCLICFKACGQAQESKPVWKAPLEYKTPWVPIGLAFAGGQCWGYS